MVCADRCVYVMRHGLAQSGPVDFDRSLSEQGKRLLKRQIKQFQSADGIRPDCLLCSTAKRVRQTAEILSDLFLGTPVFYHESLYLAPAERIMEQLRQTDNLYKRILVIGHNPGLERLISLLDCLHQNQNLYPADCVSLKILISDWSQLKTGTGKIQKIFRAGV